MCVLLRRKLESPIAERGSVSFGNLFHFVVVSQYKEVPLETSHFVHFIHDIFVDPIHNFLVTLKKKVLLEETEIFSSREVMRQQDPPPSVKESKHGRKSTG